MKAALIAALGGVTVESAEQAFAERCGPEMDALLAEMITKARRLDAEGKLDAAASAILQAEFTSRASAIGEAFAQEFFAALVDGVAAVDDARRPRA